MKRVSDNDSPDAFLPVYTTLTAKISALFVALPDQNFNVAGNAARAALVNRLKGCTLGTFGFDARGAGGSLYTFSFRDQLFYGFVPDPNAGYIYTGPRVWMTTGERLLMLSSSAKRSTTLLPILATPSGSLMFIIRLLR